MITDFIHIFKEYYITAGGGKSAIFEICGKLFLLFCRKKLPRSGPRLILPRPPGSAPAPAGKGSFLP